MPLQQFDERIAALTTNLIDDTQPINTVFTLDVSELGNLRIDVFQVVSTDTVARELVITVRAVSIDVPIGSVSVPPGAGYNGVAPVDVLAVLMPAANHYLVLEHGNTLGGQIPVALSAGATMTILDMGGYV